MTAAWVLLLVGGVAAIVWGAELFAEHLAAASVRLGVSGFALGVLLAGAEPEELATVVTASLRDAPGIAFGDVVGANVALALVALGVGAWLLPLPFDRRMRRYGLVAVGLGAVAAAAAWSGTVSRPLGGVLVALYVGFVLVLWRIEGRAPELGEVDEVAEAREAAEAAGAPGRRVGRDLVLTVTGVVALAVGSVAVVEAVKRITEVEESQTRLGLTLVGFATAFELVVLAWSSARRGRVEPLLAGTIGSFAYNATMTLGAGALVRPLALTDVAVLRPALVAMPLALLLPVVLAWRRPLARGAATVLLGAYGAFVAMVALGG
jgi:cation:H+ antiporter